MSEATGVWLADQIFRFAKWVSLLTFDFQNNDSFDCALPNLTIANLG
jgi:hypothetical protein